MEAGGMTNAPGEIPRGVQVPGDSIYNDGGKSGAQGRENERGKELGRQEIIRGIRGRGCMNRRGRGGGKEGRGRRRERELCGIPNTKMCELAVTYITSSILMFGQR
jgi:hypothetical protein